MLQAAGYGCVEDASEADVLIYNTCSIRDKAEQKVYSALGRQVGSWEQPKTAMRMRGYIETHQGLQTAVPCL